MDQLTQLYKSRVEDLQKQITILESKLKNIDNLNEDTKENVEFLRSTGGYVIKYVNNKPVALYDKKPEDGGKEIPSKQAGDQLVPKEGPQGEGGKGGDGGGENSWLKHLDPLISGIKSTWSGLPDLVKYPTVGALIGTTEIPGLRIPPTRPGLKSLEYFTSFKQPQGLRQLFSPEGLPTDTYVPQSGGLEAKPIISAKSLNPITLASRAAAKFRIGRMGEEGLETLRSQAEEVARQRDIEAAARQADRSRSIFRQASTAARTAEQIPPGSNLREPALSVGGTVQQTPLTPAGETTVSDAVRARHGSVDPEVETLIGSRTLSSTAKPLTQQSSSSVPKGVSVTSGGAIALEPQDPMQELLLRAKEGIEMTGKDVKAAGAALRRGATTPLPGSSSALASGAAKMGAGVVGALAGEYLLKPELEKAGIFNATEKGVRKSLEGKPGWMASAVDIGAEAAKQAAQPFMMGLPLSAATSVGTLSGGAQDRFAKELRSKGYSEKEISQMAYPSF